MNKKPGIAVPDLSLQTASMDDYCASFAGIRSMGFWWYMQRHPVWGNYARPFKTGGRWFYRVKPFVVWPADQFTVMAPKEAGIPRFHLASQMPAEPAMSNSCLFFNVIDDLQRYSEEDLDKSKPRAIRRALDSLDIKTLEWTAQGMRECLEVWVSHQRRTGWKKEINGRMFQSMWREIFLLPGTTVLGCYSKADGKMAGWLIAKVIDNVACIDTIASKTGYLSHKPNDFMIYVFLQTARRAKCQKAFYSLRSRLESLEKFKQSMGFRPRPCFFNTRIVPPAKTILVNFRRKQYERMMGIGEDISSALPDGRHGLNVMLAREEDAAAIAGLHRRSIEKGFLSTLNDSFLTKLYRVLISRKGSKVFVARQGRGVAGFIAGTTDTNRMYRGVVFTRGLFLAPFLISHAVDPATLKRMWETFVYGFRKSNDDAPGSDVPAELLAIAVDEKARLKGSGGELVNMLERFFRSKAVKKYKVVTFSKDPVSNGFYAARGFRLSRQFLHHGNLMNEYVKEID